MRVLFFTAANTTHLHSAAPMAWAFRESGHEVIVAGQPDLADAITATGLTGVAVGDLEDIALTERMNAAEPPPAPAGSDRRPNARQPEYAQDDPDAELASLVANLLPVMCPESVFDDLVDFARSWKPDLVVWDMIHYAGPVAARACGAAHARLALSTDGFGQLRAATRKSREAGRDPLRDWLQPKLERVGSDFGEDVAVGDWTLDPMPPWTWHPDGGNYLPVRNVPFNGPAMAPRWLFEPPSRQRVCLTLGNSHRDAGRIEASTVALVEAVADLDVEVIATLRAEQIESMTSLPDNVRAVDFVPLNMLLPTCSAVVHHGGVGTFGGAVTHGVPQAIAPSSWWTEKWFGPVAMANGLEDRGAGIYVADSDQLTAEGVRDAIARLLEPSYAQNAEQLRKETLEMPSPSEVVGMLERLTAERRASRR